MAAKTQGLWSPEQLTTVQAEREEEMTHRPNQQGLDKRDILRSVQQALNLRPYRHMVLLVSRPRYATTTRPTCRITMPTLHSPIGLPSRSLAVRDTLPPAATMRAISVRLLGL